MSIIACHSGPDDSGDTFHMTVEECEAATGGKCGAPREHHKQESRVDLERGKWSYVVLVDAYTEETEQPIEVLVEATGGLIEALRIARKAVGWRGYRPRKGLAYGLLVEGPAITATIIPTPRHTLP